MSHPASLLQGLGFGHHKALPHLKHVLAVTENKEVKEGSPCQSPPLSFSYHFRPLTGCQSSVQILILHSFAIGRCYRAIWLDNYFFIFCHSTCTVPVDACIATNISEPHSLGHRLAAPYDPLRLHRHFQRGNLRPYGFYSCYVASFNAHT